MLATLPDDNPVQSAVAMAGDGADVARSRPMGGSSKRQRAGAASVSTSSTDTELRAAISSGDAAALEEAYRRHGAAVYGLARRVLRRDDLAEDIAQEVFVRLWDRPDRFDPDRGTLRTFLQRETHSRSIERVRAEEARDRRERRIDPAPSEDATLESEVLASIRSEEIRDALADLEPAARSAIVLAYYGGLSYREVARRLGEPEGTVKSRIRTGLARLAQLLSDGTEVGR